jgi:hypothetical protein
MLAKKLLFLLAMTVASAPFFGCAATADEGEDEDDQEEEPVEQTSDELRSAVSCKERTEAAYTHGRKSSIQVVTIAGKAIAKPTGHAFLKMQAAAQEAGVRLSLSSGFRTMAEQTYFYNCYKTKRCNNGNLAASPGNSNHQNGLAVDLSTSAWLARNAARFGFVRTVSKEAWHYEFRGKDPGGPCSRTAAPTSPDDEDGTATSPTEDKLPEAGKLTWVAPAQDGSVKNGFVVKAHAASPSIVKVVYSQGTFVFGTSTAAASDFGLNYAFKYMGDKTLTVQGFDAKGTLVAVDHVDFTLLP